MLDFTLAAEQLDLLQKAREFSKQEILPVAWSSRSTLVFLGIDYAFVLMI